MPEQEQLQLAEALAEAFLTCSWAAKNHEGNEAQRHEFSAHFVHKLLGKAGMGGFPTGGIWHRVLERPCCSQHPRYRPCRAEHAAVGESILQPSAHIGVKRLWDIVGPSRQVETSPHLERNSNYLELTNATVADSSPRRKAAQFCQDSLSFQRLPHACRHSDRTSLPWARLTTTIPFSRAHQKSKSVSLFKRTKSCGNQRGQGTGWDK